MAATQGSAALGDAAGLHAPPAHLPGSLAQSSHAAGAVFTLPPLVQVVAAVLKSMLEEGRAAGLKGFEQVRCCTRTLGLRQ